MTNCQMVGWHLLKKIIIQDGKTCQKRQVVARRNVWMDGRTNERTNVYVNKLTNGPLTNYTLVSAPLCD